MCGVPGGVISHESLGTSTWRRVFDIADEFGAPVGGATVTMSVGPAPALAARGGNPGSGKPGGGGGGGTGGSLSCVTSDDGRCSVSLKPGDDTVTFVVSDVALVGWIYDAGSNISTSIEVTRH